MRTDLELGYMYLAEQFLADATVRKLKRELSACRNSPTLQGDGAALLVQRELTKRGVEA